MGFTNRQKNGFGLLAKTPGPRIMGDQVIKMEVKLWKLGIVLHL